MPKATTLFLLGTLLSAVPSARAGACSVVELRRSPGYTYRVERVAQFVESAEVIVRAVAVGVDSSGRRPAVAFAPIEWIRGNLSAGPLRASGTLVDRDDFNPRSVPYTMVRPAGQRGDCFAREYRRGAEYLLLLRYLGAETLTPYWIPLAPLNEQVTGADDAWVTWVRAQARTVGATSRDP
jgi:hypothetical protein